MYQMVVCGKTFDAHLQLMAKVQAQVQDRVQLVSCSQDGQIIVVFCPISSRAVADVDAAMTCVTGKPNVFSPLSINSDLIMSYESFPNITINIGRPTDLAAL